MGLVLALEGMFLDILHDNALNGKVFGPSDLRDVKVPPSSGTAESRVPSSMGLRISQIGKKIGHQTNFCLAFSWKTLLFVTK